MTEQHDYLCDWRELHFFLFEQYAIQDTLLGKGPYAHMDQAHAQRLIVEAQAFATMLGQEYRRADREGCSLREDGSVQLPASFERLWAIYREKWNGAAVRDGEMPVVLLQVVLEMFMGANPSFMTYGSFTQPAARLIARSGSARQKQLFLEALQTLRWDACFCATEAQAGSDLTAIALRAERVAGAGTEPLFAVSGEKKYISAGWHELTSNTLYVVLGHSGEDCADAYRMSCLLVPRYWIEEDGRLTDNNVECERLETKMGFKACANAHLIFGRKGRTLGFVLGDRERVGLLQLLPLMQKARMSTGLFALGMASSAYLHALRYARRRVQGRRLEEAANVRAPRVRIIEHADVQRMLLEMKSKVEGCRGLIGLLTSNASLASILGAAGADARRIDRHAKLAQLYTPVVKAYVSDQAWRICELSIQVHGAVGYLADLPLEQYARDVKVLSIWEGTNYIQALDLVRDKLRFGMNSQLFGYLTEDIAAFMGRRASYPMLAAEFDRLEGAFRDVTASLAIIAGLSSAGRQSSVGQLCTRFLEMLAETLVGWTLLQAACVAVQGLRRLPLPQRERSFYEGKIATARFFLRNVLPGVHLKAALIADAQQACIALASAAFGFEAPPSDLAEELPALRAEVSA